MSEQRTSQAIKQCFDWLTWCIEHGWHRSTLDDLEQLWWEYHDEDGNLTIGQQAKAS